MAFVHISSSSILFLALWNYRQDAAHGVPARYVRSLQPPEVWTSSGLVKDLSLGGPVEGLLKVVYGRRVQVSVVINGSLWPYEACLKPKSVSLDGATATECVPPFALIMVDPDAPTVNAATERSRVLWMVINAKSATELHKGEQVMQYESPTPPPGTGTHRFVFLVYCQRGKTLNGADVKAAKRTNFDVKDFEKKLGVMMPIGGTFFYAKSPRNQK
ncbi:hypothetical protein HPB51_007323 [Rhipicephalus microplus]|uniref:Phosphatidylethanolamine-binding protein n=1 Tax=Rhipicephalus microplus TaxID=6941 RepID=A0A9J6EZ30_RHIMP|nr:protein D3-like [Rhipicephalus microplus]KAH8039445.1 hypothetical protein HPB51_007323 [Rhipicephalus microplus]